MTSPLYSGCYFTLPSGREASLPLQSVSAQVHIIDGKPVEIECMLRHSDERHPVLARVTLTQYFAATNHIEVPAKAKYVFPVPSGGAVCAFEMRTSNGKVLVGEVKESRQADNEFKEAVSQDRTAGLLAKASPDGTHLADCVATVIHIMPRSLRDVTRRHLTWTSGQDRHNGMPIYLRSYFTNVILSVRD